MTRRSPSVVISHHDRVDGSSASAASATDGPAATPADDDPDSVAPAHPTSQIPGGSATSALSASRRVIPLRPLMPPATVCAPRGSAARWVGLENRERRERMTTDLL